MQVGDTPGAEGPEAGPDDWKKPAAITVPVDAEALQNSVLYADHITIAFGGLVAVDDVSFTIPPKSVVSLIGPNGAGKTTFFNVITGLYKVTSGTVFLEGRDITSVKPHERAAMGLARTFQNIRLFNLMTAEENVMVAMHPHLKAGVLSTIIRLPSQRREERAARDTARELLEYVGIGKTEGELARNLSYGDQRRLEIARAMALKPKVLLLDEPTAGMNPQESAAFNEFVYRVRDEKGISVLLIEHDMAVIMKISERITVLGPRPDDRRRHPRRHPQQPTGDRGLPRQDRNPRRQEEQAMTTTPTTETEPDRPPPR